jgi:hypothetical protein
MYELHYEDVIHETEEALLVEFEQDVQAWLPKSKCKVLTDNIIECPEWLVIEKELEGYIL